MEHKGSYILLVGLIVITLIATVVGTTFSYFGVSINHNEGTTSIINNKGTIIADWDSKISAGMVNAGEKIAIKNFTITGSATTSDNLSYELDLNVNENTYPENTLYYTITSTKSNGIAVQASSAPVAIPTGKSVIKIGNASFAGPVESGTHEYVLTIYRSENAPIVEGEASMFNAKLNIIQAS